MKAGAAGFLVWNWPPARIFMGDAGSGFIGLLLAYVPLIVLALWLRAGVADQTAPPGQAARS